MLNNGIKNYGGIKIFNYILIKKKNIDTSCRQRLYTKTTLLIIYQSYNLEGYTINETKKPACRPTKTVKWPPRTNIMSYFLNEKDIVKVYETDGRGRVRTYKRGWGGHEATVIIGEFKVTENFTITIPPEVDVFDVKIFGSGDTSVIGHKNTKVTLIVHG